MLIYSTISICVRYAPFVWLLINLPPDVYCAAGLACAPLLPDVEAPTVHLPNLGNSLIGSTTISYWKKRPIFQYLGIPFAEPPIGDLRFQPPKKKGKISEDRYDAREFKRKCPQLRNAEDYYYLTHTKDIEDCLYLNVFTPQRIDRKETSLLPVMVYIHGGGFLQGSAATLCPNYLLDSEVILVTIQYRLGPLGFLCLHTENAAGNVGFMDQIMALEWVNENIVYFGGDKNRVTLFGESAGAVSASLYLVSPLVRTGLFQQVIMQSGNLLWDDWYIDRDPVTSGRVYAKYVNCTQENVDELTACLKNVPAADLILSNIRYMLDTTLKGKRASLNVGIAQAVVQKVGNTKFLTENPVDTFKSGHFLKLPTVIGFTKDEGAMFFKIFYDYFLKPGGSEHCFEMNNCISEDFAKDEIFYTFLQIFGLSNEIPMLEMVKDKYFPEKVRGNLTAITPGLIDLMSTLMLKIPSVKFVRNTFEKMPTYLYTFNYKGRFSLLYDKDVKNPFPFGVSHGDDLVYLFPYKNEKLTNEEAAVAKTISSLWTSFAINNGKPGIINYLYWPSVSDKYGPYLVIDKKSSVNDDVLNEYYSGAYRLTTNFFVCIIFAILLSSLSSNNTFLL